MDSLLNKTNGPMMQLFDMVYKWIILNVLFVLFSIAGLIVFGIFPSWLTLHQMIKRVFFDHEEGIKYFAEYRTLFIENLLSGNILFLFVIIVGTITIFDGIYLYDQYLGIDEITIIGVLLSIGGLLLGYIVFGMISIIATVWAYYDRFSVMDCIKFSFFTVLSSPLFVLSSLLIVTGGYIVFSILVSAAPFIGVSIPVWGLIMAYKRIYRRIFLIQKINSYEYYSFRYVQNTSKIIDVLNSILPEESMFIEHKSVESLLHQDTIDYRSSLVVLDGSSQLVGFMVVLQEDDVANIELIAIKNGFQHQEIGTNMVQMLRENGKYKTLRCITNKKQYHERLEYVPNLRALCKKMGFKEMEVNQFILEL